MTGARLSVGQMRARRLIEDLGIKNPEEIDLEAIAFHLGVAVSQAPLLGAQARLVVRNGRGLIRINALNPYAGARRFAIAHELGHFELHRQRGDLRLCTDADFLSWYKSSSIETEANEFAAELLMPERLFRPRCDVRKPHMGVVEGLARTFSTSLTSTAWRFVDLADEPCALVLCENGKISWAKRGAEFRGWIPNGMAVDPRTLTYDFFAKGKVWEDPDGVPGDAWGCDRVPEVIESIRVMDRLGVVLVLLWIPET